LANQQEDEPHRERGEKRARIADGIEIDTRARDAIAEVRIEGAPGNDHQGIGRERGEAALPRRPVEVDRVGKQVAADRERGFAGEQGSCQEQRSQHGSANIMFPARAIMEQQDGNSEREGHQRVPICDPADHRAVRVVDGEGEHREAGHQASSQEAAIEQGGQGEADRKPN